MEFSVLSINEYWKRSGDVLMTVVFSNYGKASLVVGTEYRMENRSDVFRRLLSFVMMMDDVRVPTNSVSLTDRQSE